MPILRDAGAIDTPFGRNVLAAGVVGELGPILTASLVLSRRFSAGVQVELTPAFVAFELVLASLLARGPRSPRCSNRYAEGSITQDS